MYCGNNVYSTKLKQNGGVEQFGTHAKCFKKGFGIGYNAPIGNNVANFLAEWGGKYKPYIKQKLYYGDGEVPDGFQLPTQRQSLSHRKCPNHISIKMRKGHTDDITTRSHNEAT